MRDHGLYPISFPGFYRVCRRVWAALGALRGGPCGSGCRFGRRTQCRRARLDEARISSLVHLRRDRCRYRPDINGCARRRSSAPAASTCGAGDLGGFGPLPKRRKGRSSGRGGSGGSGGTRGGTAGGAEKPAWAAATVLVRLDRLDRLTTSSAFTAVAAPFSVSIRATTVGPLPSGPLAPGSRQYSGSRGRDLGINLVGRDFEDGLFALHLVALLLIQRDKVPSAMDSPIWGI